MTRRKIICPWCAKAQYPGLDPFIFGTVTLAPDALDDEIEAALLAHAQTFLPPGLTILEQLCGSMIFVPEARP